MPHGRSCCFLPPYNNPLHLTLSVSVGGASCWRLSMTWTGSCAPSDPASTLHKVRRSIVDCDLPLLANPFTHHLLPHTQLSSPLSPLPSLPPSLPPSLLPGQPVAVLEKLCEKWGVTRLTYQIEQEHHSSLLEDSVDTMANNLNISVSCPLPSPPLPIHILPPYVTSLFPLLLLLLLVLLLLLLLLLSLPLPLLPLLLFLPPLPPSSSSSSSSSPSSPTSSLSQVFKSSSQTLYDFQRIALLSAGRTTTTMRDFKALLSQLGPPKLPVSSPDLASTQPLAGHNDVDSASYRSVCVLPLPGSLKVVLK